MHFWIWFFASLNGIGAIFLRAIWCIKSISIWLQSISIGNQQQIEWACPTRTTPTTKPASNNSQYYLLSSIRSNFIISRTIYVDSKTKASSSSLHRCVNLWHIWMYVRQAGPMRQSPCRMTNPALSLHPLCRAERKIMSSTIFRVNWVRRQKTRPLEPICNELCEMAVNRWNVSLEHIKWLLSTDFHLTWPDSINTAKSVLNNNSYRTPRGPVFIFFFRFARQIKWHSDHFPQTALPRQHGLYSFHLGPSENLPAAKKTDMATGKSTNFA